MEDKLWFVYDTVPNNLKVQLEILDRRKGIWAGAVSSFAIIFCYFLLFGWLLPDKQFHVRYLLMLAFITELLLFLVIRIKTVTQKKRVCKKIQEEEPCSLKGRFCEKYILVEHADGSIEYFYYQDLQKVEETVGAFLIKGASSKLQLDKKFLPRDEILFIRNQLTQYCRGFQGYQEGEERLEFERTSSNPRGKAEQKMREKWLYLAAREGLGKINSEWRNHILASFLTAIIYIAVYWNGTVSNVIKVILCILILLWLLWEVITYFSLRKKCRRRNTQKSIVTFDKIGVSLHSGKTDISQSYENIKFLIEGDCYINTGRICFLKSGYTTEEWCTIREFLKQHAGEKYECISVADTVVWKRRAKSATFVLGFLLLFSFFSIYKSWMVDTGKMRVVEASAPNQSPIDNLNLVLPYLNLPDDAQVQDENGVKQESGEGDSHNTVDKSQPSVLSPDTSSLNLASGEFLLDECYSDNVVNEESRFYIENGQLYGISANKHGELGLGHTEEEITAKGFYRVMELASDVKHVAQGKEFVVYLNNKWELWGSGNLPGMGQTLTPVLIMGEVAFADCSEYGLVILKNDGTVWCMGKLFGSDGNEIISYEGQVQVLEQVRYVTAGRYVMAAIREDNSLWMWGDNTHGQCAGTEQGMTAFAEPTELRDEVRSIWIDRLSYSDYEEYPLYAVDEPRKYMDYCTYIQQTNGEIYACGETVGADGFIPVEVQDEN